MYFTFLCIAWSIFCVIITVSHPRRPRSSQSGRVKRRDESFQAWAEEPLGTDSHRTISKRSRECWFLIGHKKCVHHAFLYISLPSLHDYLVKVPNFPFCEGRKQATDKIFFLFVNLDMVNRNSAPEELACIWQSKWVEIITMTEKMWVHSSCDVFVVVSCRGILNSLIFTKAWSMQAWIPVVSSSLYFWKSVFSFRVDSGCLYTRLLSKA